MLRVDGGGFAAITDKEKHFFLRIKLRRLPILLPGKVVYIGMQIEKEVEAYEAAKAAAQERKAKKGWRR